MVSETRMIQRRAALEWANEVTSRRRALGREVRAAPETLDEMLLSPPVWLRSATLETVLEMLPRYGPATVRSLLSRNAIPERKRCGTLTERQRRLVVDALHRARR